jgi:hypothetical protein
VEITIIEDVFPPFHANGDKKVLPPFCLNTEYHNLQSGKKLRITIGCPINPAVIKGCKSNENPIFLLFSFTWLTFLQPWLPPPFLVTTTLVKAVDFQRMFYIGWYVINNPFCVDLSSIMWLNCD